MSLRLPLILALSLALCSVGSDTALTADLETAESSERYSWVLPGPGLVVGQPEVLGILSFPRAADGASLVVRLNGRTMTERFLPWSAFANPWWPPGLIGTGTMNPDGTEGPGSSRRAVGMLDPAAFKVGLNRLEATFARGDGSMQTLLRTFTFTPAGRRIVCRVQRVLDDQVDRHASARLLVETMNHAPAVDFSTRQDRPLPGHFDDEPRPWTLARGGEAVLYLPEGPYRIIATGGPLDELDIWEVPPTGDASHTFLIRRTLHLPHHASVDFHVHAAASRDSLVPMAERVWGYLAAGMDLLVASDHGDITDYRPLIASMPAARGRLAALPGVETGDLVSSRRGDRMGHWNIWPLEPAQKGGSSSRGRRLRHGALEPTDRPTDAEDPVAAAMYDAYREQARQLTTRAGLPETAVSANPVIQLNHPRGIVFEPGKGRVKRIHDWFNHTGFNPAVALAPGEHPRLLQPTAAGTRGLDFDAIEIWNRASRRLYLQVRKDWFALLNQGWIRTGTANTDSHTLTPELAGYPLNIVFLPEDSPAGPAVAPETLAEAVRAGRVVGTDGPVPLLTVTSARGDGLPGDLLSAPGGDVRIQVEVKAASWIPLTGVRVWGNGQVLAEKNDDGALLAVSLRLERDAWILAEAGQPEGGEDGKPLAGIYGRVVPRGMAVGFSNPVLIDVDGNGRFDPPGIGSGP